MDTLTRTTSGFTPSQPGFITLADLRRCERCGAGITWFRHNFPDGVATPQETMAALVRDGSRGYADYLMADLYQPFYFHMTELAIGSKAPQWLGPAEHITLDNVRDIQQRLRTELGTTGWSGVIANGLFCSCGSTHWGDLQYAAMNVLDISSDAWYQAAVDYITAQAPQPEPAATQETLTVSTNNPQITIAWLREHGANGRWASDFNRAYPDGTDLNTLMNDGRLTDEQRRWLQAQQQTPTTSDAPATPSVGDTNPRITAATLSAQGARAGWMQDFNRAYPDGTDLNTLLDDTRLSGEQRQWLTARFPSTSPTQPETTAATTVAPETNPRITVSTLRDMGAPIQWVRDFNRAYPNGTDERTLLSDRLITATQREWYEGQRQQAASVPTQSDSPVQPETTAATTVAAGANDGGTVSITAKLLRKAGIPDTDVALFSQAYPQGTDIATLLADTRLTPHQFTQFISRKWTGATYTILGRVLAKYQAVLPKSLLDYANNVTRASHAALADAISDLDCNSVPAAASDLVVVLPDLLADSDDRTDYAGVLNALAGSGLATWAEMRGWATEHIIAREARRASQKAAHTS